MRKDNKRATVKTPLLDALTTYAAQNTARFHMPGHKGTAPFRLSKSFSGVYPCDVTELSATGDLYGSGAENPFRRAEDLAARAFGAGATLFSAGGATLCIQTLLFSLCGRGKPILTDRHSHKSVFHAAAAYGLETRCVSPSFDCEKGLYNGLTAKEIKEALKDFDPCAVFVTSPDYYGEMADIRGIAGVCAQRGLPLIVDNAHGAHLAFLRDGALHPLALGADACVDSAHKTMPALTGGAFLHISGAHFDRDHLKGIMSMLGTSSPSHLITASLDAARAFAEYNPGAFDRLDKRCVKLRKDLAAAGVSCLDGGMRDPLRVVVDFGKAGIDARRAAAFLESRGVCCEMSDRRYLTLIPSPLNKDKDFLLFLSRVCDIIKKRDYTRAKQPAEKPQIGRRRLSMHDAVRRKKRMIPAEQSAGYVAAQVLCIYPPASAAALPGESITPQTAKWLALEMPGIHVAVVDGIFPGGNGE